MMRKKWLHTVMSLLLTAAILFMLPISSEAAETSTQSCVWKKQDNNWYYYNEEGDIQTGWSQVGKRWYFFDEDGIMQTGWMDFEGKTYYLNSNGAMKTGWLQSDDNWYYFRGNGTMQTGWKKYSGKWYYFRGNGTMLTGWKKYNGCWYYFDEEGEMVIGSITIDGQEYVFDASGVYMDPSEIESVDDATGSAYEGVWLLYSDPYARPDGYLTRSKGVVYYEGHKETWYSLNEPGQTVTAVTIPGKHIAKDGTIRDAEGYICVAANTRYMKIYSTLMTTLGPAKVYDTGCSYGTIDIYTNW
ncbi:MAG: N-acetylmuramoyl-L-alanine amidase family protein [Eubacterium sp.]|nr:N-acetylmuramoyl-L-alanine amidase family protein [Eubacterium sp.]